MEIVLALRAKLAERIGKERYELWFGAGTRLVPQDTALTVEVASPFFQDWLRRHFRSDLETTCWEVLGRRLPVQFHVDETLATSRAEVSPNSDDTACATASETQSNGPCSIQVDQPSADDLSGQVNSGQVNSGQGISGRVNSGQAGSGQCGRKFAEFSSFIVGQGNKLAFTSAEIAAQ